MYLLLNHLKVHIWYPQTEGCGWVTNGTAFIPSRLTLKIRLEILRLLDIICY
jgi:hypothetical protein